MLKFNSFMISTGNPKEITAFYEEVFQAKINEMMGWLVGGMYVSVLEHSEVKGKSQEGPRVMFNLETEDVPGEFERISKIEGAEVVKAPYQMTMEGETVAEGEETESGFWIATLADPDGNYFQLMSPWDESSMGKDSSSHSSN